MPLRLGLQSRVCLLLRSAPGPPSCSSLYLKRTDSYRLHLAFYLSASCFSAWEAGGGGAGRSCGIFPPLFPEAFPPGKSNPRLQYPASCSGPSGSGAAATPHAPSLQNASRLPTWLLSFTKQHLNKQTPTAEKFPFFGLDLKEQQAKLSHTQDVLTCST